MLDTHLSSGKLAYINDATVLDSVMTEIRLEQARIAPKYTLAFVATNDVYLNGILVVSEVISEATNVVDLRLFRQQEDIFQVFNL